MTRRFVRPLIAAACVVLAAATPAAARTSEPATATRGTRALDAICAVLQSANGRLGTSKQPAMTQRVLRVDNTDGSADLSVVLSGELPPRITAMDVLACLWVDSNGNGSFSIFSERMRSYTVTGLTFATAGVDRTATVQVHVPDAAGKAICGRAVGFSRSRLAVDRSSTGAILVGGWVIASTPQICTAPSDPPVVPEAGLPVILSISAVLSGAACLVVLRRRRSRVATA